MRDEADAAFLYRTLARLEPSEAKREVFSRLAEVEDRHTKLWRELLSTHGVEVGDVKPSLRAHVMSWLGSWLGPGLLLPLLLREEGREVKGYLDLYRQSQTGAPKETARTLARESAEHAQTLGKLSGTEGEPWHSTESGGFLRNVVYGFNDGLTANFGLVAGVVGAAVEPHVVLVSGIAGLVADALSMGSSGYLAAKSEREVYEYEIELERDEIRLMPEVEKDELALLYELKGVEAERARRMAEDVMRDPERALQEKVREELGIGTAHTTPLREGIITGTATAFGAFIPVFPFLFLDGAVAVTIAFAVSMGSHFGVGAARSVFTGRGTFRSGLDMFLVGLGVAVVGYFIGDLLAGVL
ncbi:MAG: VIT1/CCC1 transporter family protein [Gemmatimonadales bacterium]|jgi:VIT1/CCC1 family predicted Fe2+/Mn2+ transporter